MRDDDAHTDAAGLARFIDHTILAPTAAREQIHRLCDEAVRYGFASVCVNGVWASEAARALDDAKVAVCVVAGFPLGASASAVKRFEAERALDDGASEIDMVIDIGGLKSRDDGRVRDDVAAVAEVVRARGALLKAILETGALTDDEKVRACRLAVDGGAHFVKTSTGFGPGGATVADVELMRRTVGSEVGVKASGGISTLADARAMLAAGATRLGMSRGVRIMEELEREG